MSDVKLSEKQLETLLKLTLLQKKETLARLKEIEAMPDDGSVDKLALMRQVLSPTGEDNEKT